MFGQPCWFSLKDIFSFFLLKEALHTCRLFEDGHTATFAESDSNISLLVLRLYVAVYQGELASCRDQRSGVCPPPATVLQSNRVA